MYFKEIIFYFQNKLQILEGSSEAKKDAWVQQIQVSGIVIK